VSLKKISNKPVRTYSALAIGLADPQTVNGCHAPLFSGFESGFDFRYSGLMCHLTGALHGAFEIEKVHERLLEAKRCAL